MKFLKNHETNFGHDSILFHGAFTFWLANCITEVGKLTQQKYDYRIL